MSRVPDAFTFPEAIDIIASSSIIPVEQLTSLRKS
jgi:hypothetical protein